MSAPLGARRGVSLTLSPRFWSRELRSGHERRVAAAAREKDAPAPAPPEPTLVVRPAEAGAAILFAGSVYHAALPLEAGERAVLVASFGPKGEGDEGE